MARGVRTQNFALRYKPGLGEHKVAPNHLGLFIYPENVQNGGPVSDNKDRV